MMKPFEVWEVPEVCFMEDMDNSMDEMVDEELEQLQELSQINEGWIVCDVPPMVRFDHEQECWNINWPNITCNTSGT